MEQEEKVVVRTAIGEPNPIEVVEVEAEVEVNTINK